MPRKSTVRHQGQPPAPLTFPPALRFVLPPVGELDRLWAMALILTYRDETKLSQRKAAARHGLSYKGWQLYEYGERDAPRDLLVQLAAILNAMPSPDVAAASASAGDAAPNPLPSPPATAPAPVDDTKSLRRRLRAMLATSGESFADDSSRTSPPAG